VLSLYAEDTSSISTHGRGTGPADPVTAGPMFAVMVPERLANETSEVLNSKNFPHEAQVINY